MIVTVGVFIYFGYRLIKICNMNHTLKLCKADLSQARNTHSYILRLK